MTKKQPEQPTQLSNSDTAQPEPPQKFALSKNQRFFRGMIFIASGIFIITQLTAGENPHPAAAAFAWVSAFVAFSSLLAFLWSMRKKQ